MWMMRFGRHTVQGDRSWRAYAMAISLAIVPAAAAGPLSLDFPSEESSQTCFGVTAPLGGGGGGACFMADDELVETFTGVVPAGVFFTRSRWTFRMDDLTSVPTVNTFDVEINGVTVGSYSTIGNNGDPSLRTLELSFDHEPIEGPDVTLRIVATSTVPPGLSSWNWFAGGGVQLLPPTDDFNCYAAKDLKNPKFQKLTGVSLADFFGSVEARVNKPAFLCLPVDRDGGGTVQQAASVCCYKTKAPKLSSKTALTTTDALGSLQVRIAKPKLLCVPCQSAVAP